MSVIDSLTARLPFTKKPPVEEYFFALNIGPEKLVAGLWTIEGNKLKVISSATESYTSTDEIIHITDKLLDMVLGDLPHEPKKILFGVQDSWLVDDDLKEPYLKILRLIVKELELTPMAYVATSHALVHFLEKHDGSPLTSILVGIGKKYVTVTNVRSGKLDLAIVVDRDLSLPTDVEKGILTGIKSEVLPSKILIYGDGDLEKQKSELMSHPWMNKLSFLHLPKIEILPDNLEIKSIALAGAVEINPTVVFDAGVVMEEKIALNKHVSIAEEPVKEVEETHEIAEEMLPEEDNLGFIAGDVTVKQAELEAEKAKAGDILDEEVPVDDLLGGEEEDLLEEDNNLGQEFHGEVENPAESVVMQPQRQTAVDYNQNQDMNGVTETTAIAADSKINGMLKKIKLPGKGKAPFIIAGIAMVILIAGYIFIPKADVMIYVEPKMLEKEAQVIADPSVKQVNEDQKVIPGEIVQTQLSGSGVGQATGKKEIGDSAKGVVVIYNGTDGSKTIAGGTVMTTSDGLKFTLDKSVTVASRSASPSDPLSTVSGKSDSSPATAVAVGPDSNIASGTSLTVGNFAKSDVVAKTEGNFSGGTSKTVTVVSDNDQKVLLAKVTSDLRGKAVQELQNKLSSTSGGEGKKVLQETLSDQVIKKTFNKGINDQASEFSLNLTVQYKGTAFLDSDLRTIVAKLVQTTVPEGFMLNMSDAETQADVSKVEKDGKVYFVARFKARLMPKIDTDTIRKQIAGKTPNQAADIMKSYENILGSDIKIIPALPGPLERLPFLARNITVQTGLK